MRRKISLGRKSELILAWALGVIFGLSFGFILGYTSQACAAGPITGSFYQWTTESGAVSFTDDLKRVPARYKDAVTERTWAELHEAVAQKFTPESTSHAPYVWADPVLEPNPNRERDCTGHITVAQERVRQDGYDREMFTVRDECGRVVSVTPQRPYIRINR